MFKIIIFLLFSINLFAKSLITDVSIKDLHKYKQSVNTNFLKKNNVNSIINNRLNILNKEYNKKFFKPWSLSKPSFKKKHLQYGFYYKNRKVYGENLKPISKKWFNDKYEFANFEKFKTFNKKGIVVNNSNLRLIPSSKPIFLNPNQAGEGFPFDYNQNSAIKFNTPIIISHFSKNKEWALIETGFVSGWIEVKDIATLDSKNIKKFMNNNYFVSTDDNLSLYKNGFFQQRATIGTLLPYNKGSFYVVKKGFYLDGNVFELQIKFKDRNKVSRKPLNFNKANIINISNSILGTPYSWGGAMGNRDCSSFTQDFFSSFGLFLPRNSKSQANVGKKISLKSLSTKHKKSKIIKYGKPFRTLLYMKGHIMLYIGHKNGEPLIMHDFWGVKTKKGNLSQRVVVGKTVITSTEPGKELENYDKTKSIIRRIEAMNIVL